MDLSIFIKYYLDKHSDYQLSIDKIFFIKVQALIEIMEKILKKIFKNNFNKNLEKIF